MGLFVTKRARRTVSGSVTRCRRAAARTMRAPGSASAPANRSTAS